MTASYFCERESSPSEGTFHDRSFAVVHHQRFPGPTHVSIERLFSGIRRHIGPEFQISTAISPQPSRGLIPRLRNLQAARGRTADIHHIVGDVHYLAFALPADRLILTIHDCAALERLTGAKHAILKHLWFRGPMRRATVVTTISNATKQELRRWVGSLADSVRVIPNCVSSDFSPCPKPFNGLSPRVLQVGTGWNKNVLRVAEALRETPCHLEIVGTLSAEQKIGVQKSGIPFTELGRVSDDELVDAYRRCDLVVFASIYEGFGLPILEAQATGRPIVTSNRSSMPEVAGCGALLVDPERTEEIRHAVQRILIDAALRDNLVERGFANVANYYPSSIAARYQDLYEEVGRNLP